MSKSPRIVVLGGGVSSERDVSLQSSKAVFAVLEGRCEAVWIDLQADTVPEGLDPASDVIFPVLHGGYGEDGRLQRDLEAAGFAYVGCDAAASARCMDKRASKEAAAKAGVPIAPAVYFQATAAKPSAEKVWRDLGERPLVIKPQDAGSSVGLYFANSADELSEVFQKLDTGQWMVESKLGGHDVTVGVLNGQPMGVVAIRPKDGGAYDYTNKYTAGRTEYLAPAPFSESLTAALQAAAAAVFQACGGRDFARIDFFLDGDSFVFLEINTIPGLTATSLLPKSARCLGLEFDALVDAMLQPALERFSSRPS
jgi:D-alanine-D-alanine ligase